MGCSVALLLGAAACGGDDGGSALSDEEQTYADALATELTDATDGFGVTDDEAACMAESAMGVLGVKPFKDADVSPKDIEDSDSPGELLGEGTVSDKDASAIAEEWGDCADLPTAFAAAGADEFNLDADGVSCLEDGLRDNDILANVIAATFTSEGGEPDGETLRELVGLVSECSAGEGGEGGLLVESIADSLVEGAGLSQEDATCIGQYAVDTVGADRLVELTANGGDFETAPPEVQNELAAAIVAAATECNVPIDRLGN